MFRSAKVKIIRLLFVAFVLFLSNICASSWAEILDRDQLEEKYKAQEKNFTVIRNFLDAGFTEGIWNSNSPFFKEFFLDFLLRYEFLTSSNQMPPEYKWLEEYYFHKNGFPKVGVINKWQSEITIGISLPRYSEKDIEFEDDKSWGVISEIIKSLAPELTKVTGLPVKYMKVTTNEHQARIRIIPVSQDKSIHGASRSAYPQWSLIGREDELWGAVEFLDDRLDGYIFPNPNNSIGMALCKVNKSNDYDAIKADVATCLVRSLGLTGKFDASESTLVHSKFTNGLRDYDLNLLRLLYCPEIKPGMDKYQAIDVFMKNKTCIARIKH